MSRNANRIGCAEFRDYLARLDRRSFLRAGMLGATGLSLSQLLRTEAHAAQVSCWLGPPRIQRMMTELAFFVGLPDWAAPITTC